MKGRVPGALLHLVPNRFDVIGDVAVISLPSELDDYRTDIAGVLSANQKNVRTVLGKVSVLEGEKRVGRYEIILGGDTRTLHSEFGYRYCLDIREVFFNPRLSYERHRVAMHVDAGEHVLVPFCGVGPFVVPAAARGAKVVAVEKNPLACRWLAGNIRLNRVEQDVSVIRGDAACIHNMLRGCFDRAIIPTPYGLDHIMWKIAGHVRKGGMLHFYTFRKEYQIEGLVSDYESNGLSVSYYRRCGNVAPGVSRWVFDLLKQ